MVPAHNSNNNAMDERLHVKQVIALLFPNTSDKASFVESIIEPDSLSK